MQYATPCISRDSLTLKKSLLLDKYTVLQILFFIRASLFLVCLSLKRILYSAGKMQLTFKTLQNTTFQIEIDPTNTVMFRKHELWNLFAGFTKTLCQLSLFLNLFFLGQSTERENREGKGRK